MIPVLEPFRPQIEALCRRYHVALLEVFGSVLGAKSLDDCRDVDLLVTFAPMSAGDHADCYFGLWEGVASVLGKRVDLVEAPAIRNPHFQQEVDQTRRPLYAA